MSIIKPDTKTAIILFNLGGPNNLDAVQPFLFNLFNDPAIIGVPKLIRYVLATLISKKRAPIAQEIYQEIGGKSPILENTHAQADALTKQLQPHGQVETFICMRYWHPMSNEVARQVKDYAPDHIILLPLYPQFSTTTIGSSVKDWHRAAHKVGLKAPTTTLCCYPTQVDWIKAQASIIQPFYEQAAQQGTPRILFSAHGLPEQIIEKGDPYQWQVEQTTQAVMEQLGQTLGDSVDYINCYQSRVGPLKWIGPSTEDEITRAAKDGVPIVIVPIAFVSEHSETLVELDIEYKQFADEQGVKAYHRVPTVSVHDHFIQGLASLCLNLKADQTLCSQDNTRICPKEFGGCPQK